MNRAVLQIGAPGFDPLLTFNIEPRKRPERGRMRYGKVAQHRSSSRGSFEKFLCVLASTFVVVSDARSSSFRFVSTRRDIFDSRGDTLPPELPWAEEAGSDEQYHIP